jgi:outer membrane protein assembly factor BamB
MHAILVTLLAASTAQAPVKSGDFLAAAPAPKTRDAAGETRDWPQFRGPNSDAISTETGLLKEWPKKGPPLLWNTKDVNPKESVGIGLSSMSIAHGKLYTMGDFLAAGADPKAKDVKGDEFVFCYDADTGKELWRTKVGPLYRNNNGHGPRCTPTIDGDKLYVLTPHGLLLCMTAAEGSILWEKNIQKEFGGHMMSGWGYSESPLIDGDKVVVTPGGKKAAVVALDKATGAKIWTCEIPKDSGAGYASIAKAEVGGIPMYITFLGKDPGLIGVNAKTGKFLWNDSKVANGTANAPTALVHGDYVFASSGYGTGAALLKLSPDGSGGIKAEEEYFLAGKTLQNHHGGMVMLGDYIYGGHGNNDGKPFCLEWKTGKFAWGPERGIGSGSAAVLSADGNLYFRYQGGTLALIEAAPDKMNVKGQFELNIAPQNWAHLVIWHGKLYVRGQDQIRCYDVKAK